MKSTMSQNSIFQYSDTSPEGGRTEGGCEAPEGGRVAPLRSREAPEGYRTEEGRPEGCPGEDTLPKCLRDVMSNSDSESDCEYDSDLGNDSDSSNDSDCSKPNLSFSEIQVSTKTFIAVLNIDIKLDVVFKEFPITEWKVIPKKRGRVRKDASTEPTNYNKWVPGGSIISIKYKNSLRGVNLAKRKKCSKCSRPLYVHNSDDASQHSGYSKCKCKSYFRNALTVVVLVDNKLINLKISKNGKIQMTGCKYTTHAIEILHYMWIYLQESKNSYTMKSREEFIPEYYHESQLRSILIPAMRNCDFSLGFKVDRQKLDIFLNRESKYSSLFETSFGYTGVNVKIQVEKSKLQSLNVYIITFPSKVGQLILWDNFSYSKYLKMLVTNVRKYQEKSITFLIFHSGKIIMSGMCSHVMKHHFDHFYSLLINNVETYKEYIRKKNEPLNKPLNEVDMIVKKITHRPLRPLRVGKVL